MKSLISVDDSVIFKANDHNIVSIDINTLVAHNDPLRPIFFILQQKEVGISTVKLAFPIDEVDRFVYDGWLVVNLYEVVT